METSSDFAVLDAEHWRVSHRSNSALPGYLIVSSRRFATDLSELSEGALHELGPLLAAAQTALKQGLNAERVYIGRYGHVPGRTIHFHVIPIYEWIERLFWEDDRYRLLQTFAEGEGESETDGAELTFFVWREFCERASPPEIQGPSVADAIQRLREMMGSQSHGAD
ncbi:HIT family protein [Rhizobium sp. P38BS-XIX]|uniref:HIT family protein n=1 Tax=Rhizobium sp. P38BS-XIX TaxID=2726740 RepID=UPI0014570944|nr:HIT family protein [Rhizobium sp. P38BS-XIX]NLS01535.1 HIT family protein [Rhizobium sp. P38BS-XIX]